MRVSELDFKKAVPIFLIRVKKVPAVTEITFRGFDGKPVTYPQGTALFHCEHVYVHVTGQYRPLPTNDRKAFMLSKEELDGLIRIEDDVYVKTLGTEYDVCEIKESCTVHCSYSKSLKVRAGDFIVKIGEDNYLLINKLKFKSMYKIKEEVNN